MKKSLQQIEDRYFSLGYKGESLIKILEKDKTYQKLLKERKQKLTKNFKVSPIEKRKYVLSLDKDFEILGKCKKLEKIKLSKEDRSLIKFIKTQLERDWRKSLIKKINQLLKKYERKN
ncbi:MAG: hypothetical protein AB1467_02675 [Candidatus Diapherotrites archaeon]